MTTITISADVRRQLAELQHQLRLERGGGRDRSVTLDEVVRYLLDCRTQWAAHLQAAYQAGIGPIIRPLP